MLFIISDVLYSNKMLMDIMTTVNTLVEDILNGCSNNPKALDVPIVGFMK